MRDLLPVLHDRARNCGISLALAVTLFAVLATGCATDTPNPTQPLKAGPSGPPDANVDEKSTIVVTNSVELIAALAPENTGRRIRVQTGDYSLSQPLTVPDRVTLEGDGVMLFDGEGLPTGFATGTRTTLTMTGNAPGDILTLGNGVTVRGIAIQDVTGRVGNSIGVVSRDAGDRVFTTIEAVEIVNPNTHTIAPSGRTAGCGVAVLTLNPNLGADPPPHAGAAIASRLSRSVIRSSAPGVACGLFAFNFAPDATVSVSLAHNVVGGGIIASGGVSRTDAVHDSRTEIQSKHNLYRNDSPDLCAPQRQGWNAQGGSGVPAPVQVGETKGNTLRIHSKDDRIEGFTIGVSAFGGRRFFAAPTAGPTTGNTVDLELIGTTIATPSCGGAAFVADWRLAGAFVAGTSFSPGEGNTVRAMFRGVTGSGSRSNVYAHVLGPTGPVSATVRGTGNWLEFVGSMQAFGQTNRAIDPSPGPDFFTDNQ